MLQYFSQRVQIWICIFLFSFSISLAQSDFLFEVKKLELKSSKFYKGNSGTAFLYASNLSSTTVVPQLIQVYLSRDLSFDQADVLLPSLSGTGIKLSSPSYSASLPKGATIRTNVSFDLKDIPLGKYYLIIKVGETAALQLISEQFEVLESQVDLLVEDLKIYADSVQAWDNFSFSFKVKNLKNTPLSHGRFLYTLKISDEKKPGFSKSVFLYLASANINSSLEEDQVRKDSFELYLGHSYAGALSMVVPPGDYKFEIIVKMMDSSDIDISNNSISRHFKVVPRHYKLEVLESSATINKVNLDTIVVVKTVIQNTGSMSLKRGWLVHSFTTDDNKWVQTIPGPEYYFMTYRFDLKPGEKRYHYKTYKLLKAPDQFNINSKIVEWTIDISPATTKLFNGINPLSLKDIEQKSFRVINKPEIPDTVYKGTLYNFVIQLDNSFGKSASKRGYVLSTLAAKPPVTYSLDYRFRSSSELDVLSTDTLQEHFIIPDSIPDGSYNLNFFTNNAPYLGDTVNKLIDYNKKIYVKSNNAIIDYGDFSAKYASAGRDTVSISYNSSQTSNMKRKVELNYYYSADSLFTIDDIFLDTTELILTPTSRIHSHKMLATIFPFYGGSPNKYQPMYIVLVNKQTNKQEAYKIIEDLPLAVMDQNVPNQKFSLYPNPAQEYFFYYSSSTERPKRFEITDCNGRIVQSSMAENDAIQIQGLEKGLYFVKIFLNEGMNVLKLIKN